MRLVLYCVDNITSGGGMVGGGSQVVCRRNRCQKKLSDFMMVGLLIKDEPIVSRAEPAELSKMITTCGTV